MSESITCIVRDFSSTGAAVELKPERGSTKANVTSLPKRFTLVIGNDRTIFECERMWVDGTQIGVRFLSSAQHTPKALKVAKKPVAKSKLLFWKR